MPQDRLRRARISALACRDANGGVTLWLASLHEAPQRVLMPDIEGKRTASLLDEAAFETATADPTFLRSHEATHNSREIEIGAYGIARIRIGG